MQLEHTRPIPVGWNNLLCTLSGAINRAGMAGSTLLPLLLRLKHFDWSTAASRVVNTTVRVVYSSSMCATRQGKPYCWYTWYYVVSSRCTCVSPKVPAEYLVPRMYSDNELEVLC